MTKTCHLFTTTPVGRNTLLNDKVFEISYLTSNNLFKRINLTKVSKNLDSKLTVQTIYTKIYYQELCRPEEETYGRLS